MTITAVFLDLYHTLAYFVPPREQRQLLALREFGLDSDEVTLRRGYLAADHYHSTVNAEHPIHLRSVEERQEIYTRYQQTLMEVVGLGHAAHLAEPIYKRYWEMSREFQLFPDVHPALARLRDEGYRLGLITNVPTDPAEDLERVGLNDRFDVVAASCLVGCEKPDPRIFHTALKEIDVPPHEAVHVGDQFLADVEGAEAAGLKAVLLDRYDLQSGRHPNRVRSLLDLAPLLRNGLA